MKLKELKIGLIPSYQPNAGKYEGTIEYEGERGEVKLALDPKISDALLACIGATVTKFAHQVALELQANIAQSIGEANSSPAIENKP